MATKLIEKREAVAAKQKKLHEIFAEAGEKMDMDLVKCIEGTSVEKVSAIRKLNEECEGLQKECEGLVDIEQAAAATALREEQKETAAKAGIHPAAGAEGEKEDPKKSFGELFTESEAYKTRIATGQKGLVSVLPREMKTLMQTTAGWAPESLRTGRLVEYATRPIQVIDIMPMGGTDSENVKYMEETTLTNNAAEVAEGGTYGEAALVYTERSSPVEKIGVWLPITDEQLEDVAQVQGVVNQRLPFMLKQRADGQLLVGDGIAPNLDGILNVAGIQTQAKGADPVPDAVYKAMTLIRVTGRSNPNVVVMHPNDWQTVRLLRTVDGVYIWGNPSESGTDRIWGLPVVQTDAETENTGLVGDFANFCMIHEKRGIEVQITNAHDDYFIKGKQAIRADMRWAFVVYRPAAFCTVTGI